MPSLTALLGTSGPIIMGILNVTPDSFSDGGAYLDARSALDHALQMIADGAEIIDIGGESTRPAGQTYGAGASKVPLEEELRRVLPVIHELRSNHDNVLISVDTQRSAIANAAMQSGADLINDVSGGTADPEMFATAARHKAPIVLMHGHGPRFRKTKTEDYAYADVVSEVRSYLEERILLAHSAGIETVLADVGIGFAKGYEDNLKLLKHHDAFGSLDVPLLLGVSRKSTIGRAMGNNPWPKQRVTGSIAAACYGMLHGAKIIRTHDVKETTQALSVIREILDR
ncbi:MAG: dihydropteroate synthase [Bacteroidota bacterium]|nr:dihydropteroate synthase [Bacteroidota bacterium]MDP4234676.1 dihydropteroate synthase [Bacteroidota bacterium]MDP4243841.1 dihydropteroate synthase [Bacteroidota bacterium]MDP4288568.1 dihydropteroate synthase [Bacteroidota bacterium]